MARRTRPEQPGVVLPGLSELTEIGSGAFASVFRAVEEGTQRQVAVKVMKRAATGAALLEAFGKEARALAAVSSHPNIVTLYRTVTSVDGRPALVIELCRDSYAKVVRTSGPLGAPEVVSIGTKLAGALETAHRAGFVHRDLKPQNVLRTLFGEPALTDFGVAAMHAAAQAADDAFGFTTLHAPPEVLEGDPVTPATDVYGLASTMYQMLCGRAPFTAFEGEAPASVILRILRDPVRPILAAEVPLELSDLLCSALAKKPGDRPATAADFADGLRRIEATCGWPPSPYVVWGETGSHQRSLGSWARRAGSEPLPDNVVSLAPQRSAQLVARTMPPVAYTPPPPEPAVASAAARGTGTGDPGRAAPPGERSVLRPAAALRRVVVPDSGARQAGAALPAGVPTGTAPAGAALPAGAAPTGAALGTGTAGTLRHDEPAWERTALPESDRSGLAGVAAIAPGGHGRLPFAAGAIVAVLLAFACALGVSGVI